MKILMITHIDARRGGQIQGDNAREAQNLLGMQLWNAPNVANAVLKHRENEIDVAVVVRKIILRIEKQFSVNAKKVVEAVRSVELFASKVMEKCETIQDVHAETRHSGPS